jgi:tyrosine-protein kinase Etk/Wzc
LLAYEFKDDLSIESIRSFRTSMRFMLKTAKDNIIVISGPSPGIGKSFLSSNYAAVSAIEGNRVILIDADMRKGHIHNVMGTRKKPGLSECISGDIELKDVIHQIKDNLSFISCGEYPPNPAELLASARFRELLEIMKPDYDLIIIDTPPILAVTDASVIAQFGGQLFMLIRYGAHPMSEINAAVSRFERNGVKVAGLLINDVPLRDPATSGYVYSYSYK